MVLNKRRTLSEISKRNLVTYTHPESLISEQFRSIQTNISLSLTQGDKQTFLVTSPNSGEGKSTIAANLSISMALQKSKVLLIDANLRNPSIHTIFRIQNKDGLANVLSGSTTFEEVVNHTEIGRLDILTGGVVAYNPVELIASNSLMELINCAHQIYDVVIVDSPSVLEVTDTKLLTKNCDGVILVINRGRTNLDSALEAKKVLEFAKANILGVILNE